MNLAGLIVIAILALFTWNGYHTGLISKVSGIVALAISSVLVSLLLPQITDAIRQYTPVYNGIVTVCEKTVGNALAVTLRLDGEETQNGIDRDEIRWVMDQYGWDSSQIDGMDDTQLTEFLQTYFPDYAPQETGGAMTVLNELSRIEQTRLIKDLPVPDFLEKMLLNYNNSAGYRTLGVADFGEYLIHFVASMILNILAFAVTLGVTQAVVWALLSALHVFTRLPLLRHVNKAGGLALGFIQGVIVIWILLLIVSLFSGTAPGMRIMSLLNDNVVLTPLFESNVFLRIVTNSITPFSL